MSPEDSLVALQEVSVTFLGHLRAGVLTQTPTKVATEAQPPSWAAGPADWHVDSTEGRKAGQLLRSQGRCWAGSPGAGRPGQGRRPERGGVSG